MNWIKLLASICVYSRTTTIGIMPEKIKTALIPGRYCREISEQGYNVRESLDIISNTPDSNEFKIIRSIYLLQPDNKTPVNYQEEEWKTSFNPYTQELSGVRHNRKYFFIPEEELIVAGTLLYKKIQGINSDEEFIKRVKRYFL